MLQVNIKSYPHSQTESSTRLRGNHDHPNAVLSLLPRHRYRSAWPVTGRASNATAAGSAERGGDAHVCWTIAMLGNRLG
jgi:hypothetical protein